jgi:antitoxin component YwqK of YwqJK toxin-antitoxin module
MKRILAPIVLLTFLFPSLAYGVTMDDLVYQQGFYYKKFTDILFTGKTTGRVQVTLENGVMDGPYVGYWNNGQLFNKGTYKDDKKHGPWVTYHDNGQLMWKGTYKDGKMDGSWVSYNKDGTVWGDFTGTFKNDVKVK